MALCQADKMLGLVTFHTEIGVDEHYESDVYFCKFREDVALTTCSTWQYISEQLMKVQLC